VCAQVQAVLSFARDSLADGAPDGPFCRFAEVRIPLGRPSTLEIATLAVWVEPAPGQPDRLPHSLRIEAHGVVVAINSGNAGFDWLARQQAEPFDVVLDLAHDHATRRGTLHEASIRGEALGEVVLRGVVEDLTPPTMRRPRLDPDTLSVASLRLVLDSRGFITAFVLPHLLTYLPQEDPGGAVAHGQQVVVAALRQLAARGGMADADAEALVAFVQEFPRPRRRLELSVDAPVPVALPALLTALAGGELPTGLRIAATYPPR
jgi:hypothetical protein